MLPQYDFLRGKEGVLKGIFARDTSINHTLRSGGTGMGKLYHYKFISEIGIHLKKIKVWFCWCHSWKNLREMMSMLFKSEHPINKFKGDGLTPRRFQVRVFIPISEDMPKWLPSSLVIPYTVSVDSLSENVMQLLAGKIDPSYYNEYSSVRYDGMSFTDFKKKLRQMKFSKFTIKKGFNKVNILSPSGGSSTTINHLLRRISEFEREGILASSSFPYALEKRLAEEVKHQDVIVINYVGSIKNTKIKKVVAVYFLETLKRICEEQTDKYPSINFKHQIHMNEFETFAQPNESKSADEMDYVLNHLFTIFPSEMRHSNMELVLDSKGAFYMDRSVRGMFRTEYFLGTDNDETLKKLSDGNNKFTFSKLSEINNDWIHKGKHRFVNLKSDKGLGPIWYRYGKKEVGYELYRPILTMDGKVKMNTNDFTRINGIRVQDLTKYLFGKECKLIKSADIKKHLSDVWKEEEQKWINEIKEEKSKEKDDDKDKVKESRQRALRLLWENIGDDVSLTLSELSVNLGVNERTISRDLKDLGISFKKKKKVKGPAIN